VGAGAVAVPTLSAAVARLAWGQQRERLTQVSNAQGHQCISTALTACGDLPLCCCYPDHTAGESAHRDLLSAAVMPPSVVLSGSFLRRLTLEQKVLCAWSAQTLMINGEKG